MRRSVGARRRGAAKALGSSKTSRKSRLIIVKTDPASARISNSGEVESAVLSATRRATDEPGNYVVQVKGFEMRLNDNGAIACGRPPLTSLDSHEAG